jgi:hypothetical protein
MLTITVQDSIQYFQILTHVESGQRTWVKTGTLEAG